MFSHIHRIPLVDAPLLRVGRGGRMDNVREDIKYSYHTNLDNN